MARLPTTTGDSETASRELLREFLLVAHNDDGTLKGGGGGGQTPWDYLVLQDSGTYTAYANDGSVVASAADTATTSGLKAVLEGIVPDGSANLTVQFGPGRFQLLDAPVGNESWANTETGLSFVDCTGITFQGVGMFATTIGGRTNTVAASPDVGTFLFTRCRGITLRDLTVEQGGAYLSTMESINGNQAADFLFDHIRVLRSRSDAIVCDGGDTGKWSGHNIVRDCVIQGAPLRPQLSLLAGGSLAASTEYRYVVTWTEADLAGAQTAGETKPSQIASVTTDTTNKTIRISLDLGPGATTARTVYRWDSVNGWKKVKVITDNITTTWDDNGSATPSAASFVAGSTVPSVGVYLLGSQENIVTGNTLLGVGDGVIGAQQNGIEIGYKGTRSADRNRVTDNLIIISYAQGIKVIGGSDNLITGNTVIDPGTTATKTQGLRIEGIAGLATNRNVLMHNLVKDTRDANDPFGGLGINNSVSITATNTPTDNVIAYNILSGHASATGISDSGTTTKGIGTNVGE